MSASASTVDEIRPVAARPSPGAPLTGAPLTAAQVLTHADILRWLHETDPDRLAELWRLADETRSAYVGDEVHLRGLIEISNHCVRQCGYCGLRAGNRELGPLPHDRGRDHRLRPRSGRLTATARWSCRPARTTASRRTGSAEVVRRIKAETPLGRDPEPRRADARTSWRAWREAGADRYLLRFETSDDELYELIHPNLPGRESDRLALLRLLRELGYEVGSGVMVGIPGQSYDSLAHDIEAVPRARSGHDRHRARTSRTRPRRWATEPGRLADPARSDQVPNTELMTYKAVALTRLVCPQANIPSTTALATINKASGRELGLQRGANIVMPNLTPRKYRACTRSTRPRPASTRRPTSAASACSAASSRSGGAPAQDRAGAGASHRLEARLR